MATERTRLTEYENGYEITGPYASNTPTGMFEGRLPADLREYLNAQSDLSLLGRRFFRSRITEDMPYKQSMEILQKFRSLNQDPDSMVRGLLFQSKPEDVSGLSQEERQERAFEGLRKSIDLQERKDIFEQFLDKQGYDDGGLVYNKPLLSQNLQTPSTNPLITMYNRSPASQGGLDSLINPPMTDPGGADDRAAMMEMQRSTFAPYLSGNPGDTGDGSTDEDDTDQEDEDPTENIPFVDAVYNPDVEGSYEAPVSTTGTGGGQNIPSVPGANYTQQMEGLYGPYYGKNEFAGGEFDIPLVTPDDLFGGTQGAKNESGFIDRVGGGLSNAARFLIDKAGDLGELYVDKHPLLSGIGSVFTGGGGEDVDIYGETFKGTTIPAEGLGLYPDDPMYETPQDAAITQAMVDNALAVDTEGMLEDIDNLNVGLQRRPDLVAQERFENAQRAMQAKEDTSAAFGDHMGAMFAPDSGWGNATPMLSSNRDEQFATGRIGISGRMLPRASSGFGGRNPFAGEAPLPGSPDYADYVIDSMGFDPNKLQGEINKIVERDLPFVQAQDQQGNSVLIDKQTGEMTVIPVSDQVKEYMVQNPSTNFVGRVGGGMRHGGVATLMPLRY